MRPAKLVGVLTASLILLLATPGVAQEAPTGVSLASPYLGVTATAGDDVSFPIVLDAPSGEEIDLVVTDLPEGWEARIRGGGFVVDRVLVAEGVTHDLELEVVVPLTAGDGSYEVVVEAVGTGSTDSLAFTVEVGAIATGGVSLDAEFPILSGPSDVTFSFTVGLQNDTAEEVQFGLQATGLEGWQVSARPSGEARASTVTVGAGDSERLTVSVDPPDTTPAGTYPILVQAAGGGQVAETELTVEITGNFALALVTPDERLNVDVTAGRPTEMTLTVFNEGTAPLTEVRLTGIPPSGWEILFAPEVIDVIEPGAAVDVVATITPSGEAINGDYLVTVRASVAETNDTVDIRATVETSPIWGLVGIGVIVVALGVLVAVFRRFGRR